MMTLAPGREYPKYVYHATKPPVMVHSAQERAKLGSEWSDTYIHQPYPKLKYHWTGETIKVQNADEEAALEKGSLPRVESPNQIHSRDATWIPGGGLSRFRTS